MCLTFCLQNSFLSVLTQKAVRSSSRCGCNLLIHSSVCLESTFAKQMWILEVLSNCGAVISLTPTLPLLTFRSRDTEGREQSYAISVPCCGELQRLCGPPRESQTCCHQSPAHSLIRILGKYSGLWY